MADAQDLDRTTVSARVCTVLDEVFAGIHVLTGLAAAVHARALADSRKPTTTELASIRSTVLEHLTQQEPPIAGTGVIAAPDTLADEPRWLEWWRTPYTSAEPERLTVDLEPGSISSYEYTSAPWFDVPRATGHRVVVGPYVDYSGTDEYILTFAEPVHVDDRFVGVAATDVRTTDLEQALLPALSAAGPRTLLLNAHGRVIASNTPDVIVGSLAPRDRGGADVALSGTAGEGCAGLPWSLVRLTAT